MGDLNLSPATRVSASPDPYNHLIFILLPFTAHEVRFFSAHFFGVSTIMHIEAELDEIHAELKF